MTTTTVLAPIPFRVPGTVLRAFYTLSKLIENPVRRTDFHFTDVETASWTDFASLFMWQGGVPACEP